MQGLGQWLGVSTGVDPNQHLDKVIIIIVLKPYSGVNLWQGPGHRLGGST